jgi:hypothetical protein
MDQKGEIHKYSIFKGRLDKSNTYSGTRGKMRKQRDEENNKGM